MYQKGEYVIYGQNGICKIVDITNPGFPGVDRKIKFYMLEPIGKAKSRIYSRVDSDKVAIRKVMTKENIEDLIQEIPDISELWIDNEKNRENNYKEAMRTCSPKEWVRIIKTLYERGQEREEQGKKITATDEKYLRMAEDNLYSEMAFVLGMEESQMQEYIADKIGNRTD